jgi:hypothetical protein
MYRVLVVLVTFLIVFGEVTVPTCSIGLEVRVLNQYSFWIHGHR